MALPVPAAGSAPDVGYPELTVECPIRRTVQDPIDYRSPGRLAHRRSGCNLISPGLHPSPTPRRLPSIPSPSTLYSQFLYSPAELHVLIPTPALPTTLTQGVAIPRDRGRTGYDDAEGVSSRYGFTVSSSGPIECSPDLNEGLVHANLTTQHHIHSRSTSDLYIDMPSNALVVPLSPHPLTHPIHQPQIEYDKINGGSTMCRQWEEADTPGSLLHENYDPELSDMSTDLEDGIASLSPYPTERSATESSPTTPSSSVPTVDSSIIKHQITEDTSITKADLNEFFPPSSLCVAPTSSRNSTQSNKWLCPHADCGKRIRGQDKKAHMLEHRGLKRFTCSCGGSFARSQDKQRHVREQAICARCLARPVGRSGSKGVCRTCLQEEAEGESLSDTDAWTGP